MNILYLINYAGAAGTEKYVENLMTAAEEKGHRCHLVYGVPGLLSETTAQKGFSTWQLDMRPQRIFAAAAQLADYCREQGVEVIHAQYPRENVIALLAKKRLPALRVVFTSHLTIRQGLHWRLLNRFLTGENHVVISVCGQGVKLLEENGVCPRRIRVIPNGIVPRPISEKSDAIRQEFSLTPEHFVLLTMARYAPEKGLGWLLAVLERVRELTDRPFACVIAGTGEEYESIAREIHRRGLERQVIQAGYRRDGDRLMASADAYVSTALYNEAMSFAILEAMAAGLPLAVTDVGAGAELAAECGFAVLPGDTEAMARGLVQLMEDAELCALFGAAAREKASRDYDLTRLIRQVLETYNP